jgi:hypothetical protein
MSLSQLSLPGRSAAIGWADHVRSIDDMGVTPSSTMNVLVDLLKTVPTVCLRDGAEDVPAFVELESGGPPPDACGVVRFTVR